MNMRDYPLLHLDTNQSIYSCSRRGISVFEIRLSNLLARKLQNQNIYIDSIEQIWQKSLVRINFHWPWATRPLLKSMTGIYISTILSDTTNVTPLFQCYLLFKKHRRQQTDVNMLGKHKYITRYDYNLTIMKSPKPATDTIYPHMKF